VINGLTDLQHPCQILADLLTVQQHLGTFDGKRIAWIGDGNNMANSWCDAALRLGFELRLACPPGYDPDPAILARAQAVWASMGQEEEKAAREQAFGGWCLNEELIAEADARAIVLHCLPAYRGLEISAGAMEGSSSRIFEQAENRLHAQQALLAALLAAD